MLCSAYISTSLLFYGYIYNVFQKPEQCLRRCTRKLLCTKVCFVFAPKHTCWVLGPKSRFLSVSTLHYPSIFFTSRSCKYWVITLLAMVLPSILSSQFIPAVNQNPRKKSRRKGENAASVSPSATRTSVRAHYWTTSLEEISTQGP